MFLCFARPRARPFAVSAVFHLPARASALCCGHFPAPASSPCAPVLRQRVFSMRHFLFCVLFSFSSPSCPFLTLSLGSFLRLLVSSFVSFPLFASPFRVWSALFRFLRLSLPLPPLVLIPLAEFPSCLLFAPCGCLSHLFFPLAWCILRARAAYVSFCVFRVPLSVCCV